MSDTEISRIAQSIYAAMSGAQADRAVSQAARAEPAALEHRLVVAMSTVAQRIVAHPEVESALVAADCIRPGLVIGDAAKAAEVVDLVKSIIAGERVLAAEEKAVLRIPYQMEEAVKATTSDARGRLAAAKTIGNNARVAWQQEERRRAAEHERQLRVNAEAAAKAAALEVEPFGEDAPPVAEVAPVVPPRTVAGGAGKSHTQVRTRAVEIVDFAQVPPVWLVLAPAVAKAAFDLAVLTQEIPKPEPGSSVVWRGVKFEAVESAVNR